MKHSEIKAGVTRRRKKPGNLILGIAFLVIGSLLFAREFGADLPSWFFRWEIILIIVGISIGVKSGFRDFGWIAVTGVGFFFLSDDIFPGWNASRFIVPVVILALGAFIILSRISPARHDEMLSPNPVDPEAPGIDDDTKSPNRQSTVGGETFRTNTTHVTVRSKGESAGPNDNVSRERGPDDQSTLSKTGERFRNAGPNDPYAGRGASEQFSNAGQNDPYTGRGASEQVGNAGPNDPYTGRSRTERLNSGNANDPFNNRNANDLFVNHAQMEEEQLDIVSVFSAVNRKVFSKNFVGGEIVCVFGGSEVNLMNADISAGTIELEVVCIFGGATLFVPPNWHVRSEMGSVFGGIDDKRKGTMPDPSKTLVIKGVCIFGGLEVKSKYQ